MSFNPFAGASAAMFAPDEGVDEAELRRLDLFGKDEATNALELAVSSGAKRFLKAPLVQQVVRAIDRGDVIYTPEAGPNTLLADSYKPKPVVEIYDWRQRPYLDHHRLRVPRIRGRLEFATFAAMLALFLATQATYHVARVNVWEALFVLWGIGFALDEYSALAANGLTTYASGAFNILDSCFCVVLFAFLGMRGVGLARGDDELGHLAFDTLGLAGCVLLPRLTISLLRHNVILLALSKMIRDFCAFMVRRPASSSRRSTLEPLLTRLASPPSSLSFACSLAVPRLPHGVGLPVHVPHLVARHVERRPDLVAHAQGPLLPLSLSSPSFPPSLAPPAIPPSDSASLPSSRPPSRPLSLPRSRSRPA